MPGPRGPYRAVASSDTTKAGEYGFSASHLATARSVRRRWFGVGIGDYVRIRWYRWFLLYPRMCIAAAGYAVVAIFALGYSVAQLIGMPIAHAVVAGVIAAAPMIVAVIGERVTGIKAFGVELNLTDVAAPIAGDNRAVATDLSDVMGQGPISIDTSVVGSSASGLSGPMEELVRKKSKLLQIDLRNDEYWWPTRLFLVAALAQDYTDVEALVSVRMKARKVGPMLIDGDFGPLTAAAVRDFQQDKNIGVDGIVGPITWRQCVTEPA